jgi:Astacin (Peptidase family M12A)
LNLTPNNREVGCFRLYTIVHEFLHALGFFHMQSATERDEYVKIVWEKIQSGTETNFDAYGSDYITNYNVEYDYGSVMHYPKTAFSIDGADTIVPLKELGGLTMGQRLRLSTKDIARVNRMYCDESVRPPPRVTAPEIIQAVFDKLREVFSNIFANMRQS